jgi:arylamine N-acetyltransferase
MILIVIIEGAKYMVSGDDLLRRMDHTNVHGQVDVGFGNNCATAPLPLREGATATVIAPSEMRIVRENIAEFTDPSQKVWIYQVRYNPESNWVSQICFSDVEFLPQDFGVMNCSVSQSRTSWFTQIFICTRMILNQSGTEIIGQCVMSGKEVKQRLRGETQILQTLGTEDDRVKALAKYFDMHLRESEIQGIRGLASELK